MKLPLCAAMFFLAASMNTAGAAGMSSMDNEELDRVFALHNPVKKFKQLVDFDRLTSEEEKSAQVSAKWKNLNLTPVTQGLAVGEVSISESTLPNENGRIRFTWILRSNVGPPIAMNIEIFETKSNIDAQKLFMLNAELNSMFDLPFNRGPSNLGTVSAVLMGNHGSERIFWTYRNMYFEIRMRGDFDYLKVAKFVQDYAEAGLTVAREP